MGHAKRVWPHGGHDHGHDISEEALSFNVSVLTPPHVDLQLTCRDIIKIENMGKSHRERDQQWVRGSPATTSAPPAGSMASGAVVPAEP